MVNCKGKEIERFEEPVGFKGSGRVERGERELDVKTKVVYSVSVPVSVWPLE